MKSTILCITLFSSALIFAQGYTTLSDSKFEQALIDQNLDDMIDGKVLTDNINTLTSLDVSNKQIKNLTGIEDFVKLEKLYCYKNELTSLDLTKNTLLKDLQCQFNKLTSLDLTKNTLLEDVQCQFNELTSLDLTKNTEITELYSFNNKLTRLDVTKNTKLTILRCYSNQLMSVDISKNTLLKDLRCHYNQLKSLNLTNNTLLKDLACNNNQLTSLDVANNTELTTLNCRENPPLKQINVKNGNNVSLTTFNFLDNSNLTCVQVDNAVAGLLAGWFGNVSLLSDENCDTLSLKDSDAIAFHYFPNPVKNTLTFTAKNNINSIFIYNTLGQKVQSTQPNATKSILRISELQAGIYHIKISIDNTTETIKIIKE